MTDSIPARVAALKTMPMPELKVSGATLFDTEPPPFNRRHLENRHRLPHPGARLRRVEARDDPAAGGARRAVRQRQHHHPPHPARARPVAGTRLIREYRGVEQTVTVLADGYEWEGRPYRSLSAIARAITGTRWNGLVFFGLKRQGSAA